MNMQTSENMFRATLVCIDSYDHKILSGRIISPYFEGCITFNSTIELLLQMESLLEEMNWPQSFSSIRSFKNSEEKSLPISSEHIKEGKLATFYLRVLFRQNSSWQGSVFWHEKMKGESFRSVLELLTLMDSALSWVFWFLIENSSINNIIKLQSAFYRLVKSTPFLYY